MYPSLIYVVQCGGVLCVDVWGAIMLQVTDGEGEESGVAGWGACLINSGGALTTKLQRKMALLKCMVSTCLQSSVSCEASGMSVAGRVVAWQSAAVLHCGSCSTTRRYLSSAVNCHRGV